MTNSCADTQGQPVLLRDGTVAIIREISAADHAGLLALHENLSPRTLYLRFFSASRQSASNYVTKILRPGTADHGGIVLENKGRLVGVAAYESIKGEASTAGHGLAEVAFVVSDDQHGRGIATLLLEHLAALAQSRGISEFVAETLPENAAMLDVFAEAGYDLTMRRSIDDVQVAINLTPGTTFLGALDRREREATHASLLPLFHPRSVAVVGASPRRRSIGGALLHNIRRAGFAGPIYPVNQRVATHAGRRTIDGLPAFARLTELPRPVDLVIVAIPASGVLAVLDDCQAAGAKSVVVISAGFADSGPAGAALQQLLLNKARAAGVRLVGPNCLGITSAIESGTLAATFAPHVPVPGPVGVLTQSGGLGIALLEHTRRAGIGLSTFVSVGNKIDVSGNDLLSWWADDPATKVAVLYLESFGNPRKFARLARYLALRKPVVAIKAGRSSVGARAAQSHTAAAATPERSVAALFQQAGVINVDHIGELIDVVTFLATQPLPAGPRLAILGNAGGPGIMAADAAAEFGLAVPTLSGATQSQLRARLPAGAAVTNPVDTVATASGAQIAAAAAILLEDPTVDALLAVVTPTALTGGREIADAIASAAGANSKPVVITSVGSDAVTGVLTTDGGRQLPIYAFPETAARAISHACEYVAFRDRPTGRVPHFKDIRAAEASRIISAVLSDDPAGGWLDPDPVHGLLAAYGIASWPGRVVTSEAAAAQAATELSLPVAVKAIGPQLVHKSDVGGVVLGVQTRQAARRSYREMQARLGNRMTGALVQPMAPAGVETIVGVTSDPAFGPLVMFGLGGTWADLLADHAFRLVPVTDVDAAELVRSVRSAPLLHGYRGAPRCDVAAIEQLVLRVGQLADDHQELVELDLNPVVATPEGVCVLDVKARIAPQPSR